MHGTLAELALRFSMLSLLSFGGANTILPEIQRIAVDQHGWMTAAEFSALFGLARALPGPNVLVVALVGWKVAGVAGAMLSLLAMCVPASVLACLFYRAWLRWPSERARRRARRAISPIAVGLVLASSWLLARPFAHDLVAVAIVLAAAFAGWRTRLDPIWILGAGAVIGAAATVI